MYDTSTLNAITDAALIATKIALRTKTYTIDPRNYIEYESFEGNYLWQFNVHNDCRNAAYNT